MRNQKEESQVGFLIETSWEVCNKVGGIYTVLSSKAAELHNLYGDNLIFIGPDVWTDEKPSPDFKEYKTLLSNAAKKMNLPSGIKIRVGRWQVPGNPIAILVDFKALLPEMNPIFGQMWQDFGVDSLHAYGDYTPSCAFAVAASMVIEALAEHLKFDPAKLTAHFDEWTTGMGLLYLKKHLPQAATVFTTHATSIGRSICSNGKALYEYFTGYNGDQMARELNMEAKHSLEKTAAMQTDCFTTVSAVTAAECTQLLGVTPQIVTPNGFNSDIVPKGAQYTAHRRAARKKLLETAAAVTGEEYPTDTFIVATSGRNEYRNKGLDLFIDSLCRMQIPEGRKALALILVPAWVAGVNTDKNVRFATHRLHNEESDSVWQRLAHLGNQENGIRFIYVPCYLDGHDGAIDISYYNLLPGLDATVFASYYEPWGYTPLESVAFGVPTVTTNKAGFGQWVESTFGESLQKTGVDVVERNDNDYQQAAASIATDLETLENYSPALTSKVRKAARTTASHASWNLFIKYYVEAFEIAHRRAEERNKH